MIALALRVSMCGPVMTEAPPDDTAVQPRPGWFDAIARDLVTGEDRAILLVCVRPDGWRAPAGTDQDDAERTGVRPASPLPLLADLFDASDILVCADRARVEHALRIWRAFLGRPFAGAIFREGLSVVDLAPDLSYSATATQLLDRYAERREREAEVMA